MGNVQPKGAHFDDDADFAASFVLDRGDVEDALAAETARSAQEVAVPSVPSPVSKKFLYAGAGAAAALIVVLLGWLAL